MHSTTSGVRSRTPPRPAPGRRARRGKIGRKGEESENGPRAKVRWALIERWPGRVRSYCTSNSSCARTATVLVLGRQETVEVVGTKLYL